MLGFLQNITFWPYLMASFSYHLIHSSFPSVSFKLEGRSEGLIRSRFNLFLARKLHADAVNLVLSIFIFSRIRPVPPAASPPQGSILQMPHTSATGFSPTDLSSPPWQMNLTLIMSLWLSSWTQCFRAIVIQHLYCSYQYPCIWGHGYPCICWRWGGGGEPCLFLLPYENLGRSFDFSGNS